MAKRGRPRKNPPLGSIEMVKADLKTLEVIREEEIKQTYEELAKIRSLVSDALHYVGSVDGTKNLSEAAFTAGKAFMYLDKANDQIEDILERIYDSNDVEHYHNIN